MSYLAQFCEFTMTCFFKLWICCDPCFIGGFQKGDQTQPLGMHQKGVTAWIAWLLGFSRVSSSWYKKSRFGWLSLKMSSWNLCDIDRRVGFKDCLFFWGITFQKLGENEPQFDEHMFQIHSGWKHHLGFWAMKEPGLFWVYRGLYFPV